MPVCVTRVVLVLFDREMEFKAKLGDSSGEISPVGAEWVTANKVRLSLPQARPGVQAQSPCVFKAVIFNRGVKAALVISTRPTPSGRENARFRPSGDQANALPHQG